MRKAIEEITCIICPRGCKIQIVIKDDKIVDVTGFACPNGREYAIEEVKSPGRIVMSVVKCVGGDIPTVSVKTSKPVPKEKMLDVMEDLSKIEVKPPVNIEDTIIENVAGTQANVVATRPVKEA